MQQELLKRARECRFLRGALLDLAAVLPPNDDELDRLIGQAVEERDNDAFVRLVFAALGAGRRVDARHLEGGASLFDDPQQLAAAAMHVSGDVARALIGAVQSERLGAERNATALLLAGLWCKENANAAFPPELIVQARIHARRAGYNLLADIPIFVLCHLLQDEGLTELLRSKAIPPPSDAAAAEFISLLVGPFRQSALPVIPERPGPVVHSGYTMRRAVARIGRNDQCPCGSGKKYKKCCIEKDQERLQSSSSLAGLTLEEVRQQRERFLTEDELLEMRSHELARLNPEKVAEPLRPVLIDRLHLFGELEAAVRLFETTGVPDNLRGHWLDCIDHVVRSRRKDLLLRLLKLRHSSEGERQDFRFAARLLLADESDALRMIEAESLAALQDLDGDAAIELAYALLEGQWPALGILVSHGLVAHRPLFDAEILFDALLETRDKLNLSPDDPLQTILDERFEESIEAHRDSEALKMAHDRLEAKNRELSDARSKLARMQTELESKERQAERPRAVAALPVPVQPATDMAPVNELRRRMASLKEELKQRHSERNQLRQELKAALETVEELRQKETLDTATEEAESIEEGLLDEPEPMGVQPVRVPEFSQKFRESLDELPSRTVRHSMALIGRLAAGESGAFTGIKRLKTNRDIVRQRVGADYRLLFRLHSKTIELLALIPRRDLERKIRSLTTA